MPVGEVLSHIGRLVHFHPRMVFQSQVSSPEGDDTTRSWIHFTVLDPDVDRDSHRPLRETMRDGVIRPVSLCGLHREQDHGLLYEF